MSPTANPSVSSAPDAWEDSIVDAEPDAHDVRPRKRRRKYIAKACNECKRRKIKCNGENPCQRCGRQRLDCVYADVVRAENSGDDQTGLGKLCDQMSAMQEQIAALSAVCALAYPGHGGRFDLARSSLQRRGIVEHNKGGEEGDVMQEPSPLPSPPSPAQPLGARHVDPLWTIGKTEALRLCQVYEEEMGIMYPVLDLEELLHQVNVLYGTREPRWRSSLPSRAQGHDGKEALDADDVHIIRLVFACALTAEASGNSELAMGLFVSIREAADNAVWGAPEIKTIIFLTLVSIFYFQIDEETLAWRTIGIVERMCLEKGLHRRETLTQPAVVAAGRDRVLRLFWSIYILDMRWSFGTGMPFSLEDTDIDPWLPEPEEKTPYLRVMIRYSRIAAKVWKFISAFNNTNEIKKDEMNYLDWQVLKWVDATPDSLRFNNATATIENQIQEPRCIRRLRSLLYLRANQLRMLIYRPVLHSAAHIVRYPSESQTVVEIAKDTIRFITRLNETSDIYRLQQVTFNWFLVSALAVLFLAVVQTPGQFSSSSKEEFYMALELVKGFSTRSYISRRLWKSIKSLRKLAPQLGLQRHRHVEEPLRTDVVGVPCTAAVAEPGDQAQTSSIHSHTPLDGAAMTQELVEWFEAVGNLENQIMGVGSSQGFDDQWQLGTRGPNGYMFDYGGELSTVMRDCF
ncbi:conserved hypothetical protein [Aspergillus terreus NIH2624]|uniref:Zn(2)-C6 fungal-type domain-containing protein n=1 Tax=Aspergillus terreus (strain NIH 2624 / FGSC A1156) TaxID=341663 RepID=Q0C948_ASPTN|nr:uncharacterized protein ATEG_09786 [Aspergillus terreus NIH2624]EAU29977.1 conserved hypothetical protein [Aspergillus terreus NIH2624]